MKLGQLYKKAEQFETLQKELPVLIQLSNVNKLELINRVRMAKSHFYRRLNEGSFNSQQLLKIFTAIVEIQNLKASSKK